MGLLVGPTPWWQANLVSVCPEGTYLPDGSTIICKSGGTAWIVAPLCTQVNSAWAGGQYNNTLVGDKCCISEWSGLETQLINCGFNPCDWFVPSFTQLQNPGDVCKDNWDCYGGAYWSSTEVSATSACRWYLSGSCAFNCSNNKPCIFNVRAMRCVTY